MPFLTAPLESSNGDTSSTTTAPGQMSDMETAASQWVSDTIVLSPTSENEWLPMHPEYPADIFTSCLTTPIQMALRWFVRCNPQSMGGLSPEAVDSIPGKAGDRKTPLGELTWIFAAVTDSIAWNVLPRPLFQRLFRQDLLVAGMFRNFLLADRILRSLNCSPQSYPPLPPGVCDHPLWQAWDQACETCLYGLMHDGILTVPASKTDEEETTETAPPTAPVLKPVPKTTAGLASSVSSPFFSEQLSAFEIWLDFASVHMASPTSADSLEPFESPEQLPIVLQVLLTPAYRVRALTLLRRFLDLGPYAVNVALSLGILPYVTKLLQSPEYKQDLMAIWAKILAFDPSCQQTVLKDGGLPHFISHLTWGINTASIAIPVDPKEAASQRTMTAFILAITCLDFPRGQAECVRLNLHGTCSSLLSSLEFGSELDMDPEIEAKLSIASSRVPLDFRKWLCLCLGNLVKDNSLVQNQAFGSGVHRRLLARISDDSPDISAAACYALGCMVGKNRNISRSGSRQDLQQQQPVTYPTTSAQPNLISNRLIAPSNAPMRPTFAPGHQSLGMMPLQSAQFSQGAPRMQPPGFNTGPVLAGTAGTGMVPTAVGGGRQMDRSFLDRQQVPLISPQFAQNATDPRHSVFQDDRRIVCDVSVAEGLLRATEDASAMVRYEAVVSLARLVEKYLDAFVALADAMYTAPDYQKEAPDSTTAPREKLASLVLGSVRGGEAISIPDGLDESAVATFTEVWRVLRFLQRQDPYPDVSSAAVLVVSFVHEHVLRIKMELIQSIGEEDATGIRSLLSLPSISGQHQEPGRSDDGNTGSSAHSSESKDNSAPLRRIASVSQSIAPPERLSNRSKSEGKVLAHDPHLQIDYELPVSKFFEWQRDVFADQSTVGPRVDEQPIDPLSFKGAVKSYREQRNRRVHEASRKYTNHFSTLAPKPPPTKKKQRFNIDLSEEEDEAANEADAKKKRELELKQKNCIKNDGADMSCILKFHSYEDALCVCDGHDGISVWDARKNGWGSMFSNGNAKGSRMTSATWVNEMSSSLFLVGCDDGSVRIWDGLIKPNGRVSSKSPSLSAAFFAMPGMVAGGGSGLVLDWQQYSGRLIAGGSSSQIRCWDLNAEKCASVIETGTKECVTTINTACRYDPYGAGFLTEGFRGLGPDVIVVGHGDGTMRLFDIRMNQRVSEAKSGKGRRPRVTKYDGHGNWIVSACLTGYTSRPEVVSGSVDGEIKTWDLRLTSCLRTYTAQRRPMTALSVHPNIPLLATGSHTQFIKVMTLDGDTLQVIRYHEALSGHRMGPVGCLEFHPYKPLLASGGTDSIVSIYSPKIAASIG